jgi:hypothetical protein
MWSGCDCVGLWGTFVEEAGQGSRLRAAVEGLSLFGKTVAVKLDVVEVEENYFVSGDTHDYAYDGWACLRMPCIQSVEWILGYEQDLQRLRS